MPRQEGEVARWDRQSGDQRVEIRREVPLKLKVEHVTEVEARMVGGEHDEPATRPVLHVVEGLGAEARRAVHEHDGGIGTMLGVER